MTTPTTAPAQDDVAMLREALDYYIVHSDGITVGIPVEVAHSMRRRLDRPKRAGTKPPVDWSVFQAWPRPTLTCICGTQYRSHCKHTWHEGKPAVGVAETPCPNCGADCDHIKRVEHPPYGSGEQK